MNARIAATLAVSIIAVPVAFAQDQSMSMGGEITFSGEAANPFTEMTMDLELTIGGEAAKQFRGMMDSDMMGGDGDGRVEDTEVAAFRAMMEGQMGNSVDDIDDQMTIDSIAPTAARMDDFSMDGATGSVESTQPIALHFTGAATYAVTPGNTHTLRVQGSEGGSSDDEIDFTGLSLKAPSGWTIDSRTGVFEEGTLSANKQTLTFTFPASGEEGTIVFKKASSGGGKSLPSAGVGLVVAVLAAGIVLRRRDA